MPTADARRSYDARPPRPLGTWHVRSKTGPSTPGSMARRRATTTSRLPSLDGRPFHVHQKAGLGGGTHIQEITENARQRTRDGAQARLPRRASSSPDAQPFGCGRSTTRPAFGRAHGAAPRAEDPPHHHHAGRRGCVRAPTLAGRRDKSVIATRSCLPEEDVRSSRRPPPSS